MNNIEREAVAKLIDAVKWLIRGDKDTATAYLVAAQTALLESIPESGEEEHHATRG